MESTPITDQVQEKESPAYRSSKIEFSTGMSNVE